MSVCPPDGATESCSVVLPVRWCACGSRGSRYSDDKSSSSPRYRLGSYGRRWWRRVRRSSRGHYTHLARERGLEKHRLLNTNRRSEDRWGPETRIQGVWQMGRVRGRRGRRQTVHDPSQSIRHGETKWAADNDRTRKEENKNQKGRTKEMVKVTEW